MSFDPQPGAGDTQPTEEASARPRVHMVPMTRRWLSFGARTVARIWVIGFLVAAAVISGMAIARYGEAQRELAALQAETSPQAYAVLAYRHELERQIAAYRDGGVDDVTPAPPPRPRLMEEIDIARARNAAVVEEQRQSAVAAERARRGSGPRSAPAVEAPN